MDDERGREGGCSCGATRYRMLSAPLIVHCCHCSWCQRETGSAFAINALIETDRLQLLCGEVEVHAAPTASGSGQDISSCVRCKVVLWSRYALPEIADRVRFVRVGTLDQPALAPPDVHIFTGSQQSWFSMAGEAPQYPEYYRHSEVWSKSSLARRRLLLAPADSLGV